MFERGDWVVPMFNGHLFPEKPPLMFWNMMAGFQLFGVNASGVQDFSRPCWAWARPWWRFISAESSWNVRVGLWAGLTTASTIIFTVSARAATVDMALCFVTTLAMLLFVIAEGE